MQFSVLFLQTLVQTEYFSKLLISTLDQLVPKKTLCIQPDTPAWSNTYTSLLLCKKNRNYCLFRRAKCNLAKALLYPLSTDHFITILQSKKKTHKHSRIASNESLKANQKVKDSFYNTVNVTMNNPEISAKKKCSILTKLLDNKKYSFITPLLQNGQIISESKQKVTC